MLRFLDLVNSLSINIGTLHVTSLLLFWSVVYLVWLFEFLSCNLRSRISCLNPNLHICFAFEYQRKLFIMIKSHNVLIYRNAKHKSWTIFRVELYNLQSCSDHRVDRQLFIHNTLILWTCTFAKYWNFIGIIFLFVTLLRPVNFNRNPITNYILRCLYLYTSAIDFNL